MGKAGRGGRGGRRGCLISITLVGLLLLLARSESSESGKVLATGNVNRGQDGDGDDGGEETTTTTVSPADGLARSWLNATRTVEEEDPFKDLVSKIPKSGKRSGRSSVCKISEFGCRIGKCISSDKFCDGVDHCGDGSDEPRFCTPCNRTYYGEWGWTYSISLSSATIAAALGLSHEQQLLAGDQPATSSFGGSGKAKGGGMSRLRNLTSKGGLFASGGITTSSTTSTPQMTASPLPPVKRPGLPPQFVCQLTFAAAGDNFGDFIQVMFDEVNIGHFVSPSRAGCPDGSLQIAEINRPLTGGKWCGSGSGYAVYFSETSAIALTLGVTYSPDSVPPLGSSNLKFSRGSNATTLTSSPGRKKPGLGDEVTLTSKQPSGTSSSTVDDFEFKIRFKFIPRSLASVRFGTHGNPIERGEVVPGSYCSRDFEACHRRRCRLQSPNYPGLYPRNVSCHYTIRHRAQQPCKHVLLQVSQNKGHKVQLKSVAARVAQVASQLVQEDAIVAWEDCAQGNRDTITIYDGTSTDDPVLLVVCGGGHIPPVTSSSSELLLVFRATPFGNPLEARPSPPYPEPLRGFELDVDVIMVDSESAEYSNVKNNCTFFFVSEPSDKCLLFKPQEHGGNWITGSRGKVTNLRHTISPNTTCRYEFKGTKHEIVWVYFVSYSRSASKDPNVKPVGNCSSRLSIKDGIDLKNEALLGSYCDNELPKLCDHKALQNELRVVRSCTEAESYISAGPRLIIEQTFFEGTALRPINYQFHYEFVSRHSGSDGTCHRSYVLSKMKSKGVIRTTDNVFDFGRGGRANLSCTYTFILGAYEGLKLTLKSSSFGDRPCRTMTDFETGRYICNYLATPSASHPAAGNNTSMGSGGAEKAGNFKGPSSPPPRSEVHLHEYIWPSSPSATNITSHAHCICSNFSSPSPPAPTFTFLGRKVELTFVIDSMGGADSHENFFAHFDYEVVKEAGCRGDNHHMRSESGLISLDSTYIHGVTKNPTCDQYPWLLEARENHSLYLRIPGYPMIEEKVTGSSRSGGTPSVNPTPQIFNYYDNSSSYTSPEYNATSPSSSGGAGSGTSWHTNNHPIDPALLPGLAKFQLDRVCPTTKNRILIYDGDNKLVQKICPASFTSTLAKSPSQIVEIYSEDFGKFHSPLWPAPRARFVIEFVGRELGSYQIKWLELISAKMKTTLKAAQFNYGDEKVTGQTGGGNATTTTDGEQDGLRPGGKPSWDETLSKLFEGQNGDDDPLVIVDSSQFTYSETNYPIRSGVGICTSYCPELRACISDKLWCDGEIHCPISRADESNCDSFWATVNQLLSPAVYIPVVAAALSALCCCGLVILCVAVKRMVLKMRDKGQLSLGIPSTSAPSSRTSTVDRRQRDYFYDPHQPNS